MKNILLIVFILVFLLLFPISRFLILDTTNKNDKLKGELKKINRNNTLLRLKIENLQSITRLEKYAQETLNLRYPSGKDYEWFYEK